MGSNGLHVEPTDRSKREYSFRDKMRRGKWNPLATSSRIKQRYQNAKLEVAKSKHVWKSVGKLGADDVINVIEAFFRNKAVEVLEGKSVSIIPSFSFSPWIVGIIVVVLILIKVL